ncbi:hypothetical protein FACS1894110_03650 [Spirochaetia bacterium]|nr:hypothetical protein FACS1894110_03650 [Spirochaetia bacterium]
MPLIPETPPPPDAPALAENVDGVPAVKLDKFLADIAGLNPDNMTPMEALKKIQGWKAFFASVNSGRQGGKGNGLRRKQAPDETESPGLFD